MAEGLADDVKKTYQDLVGIFEALHIPCERPTLEHGDDVEEGLHSQS